MRAIFLTSRLLLVSLISACGASTGIGGQEAVQVVPAGSSTIYHDARLAGWLDDFVDDAAARGLDLSLNEIGARVPLIDVVPLSRLQEIDRSNRLLLGLCQYYIYEGQWRAMIYVRDDLVPGAAMEARGKATLYHELGHCLFKLPHVDNYDDLMYPGSIHVDLMAEIWERVLDTFFARAAEYERAVKNGR